MIIKYCLISTRHLQEAAKTAAIYMLTIFYFLIQLLHCVTIQMFNKRLI